MIFLKIGLYEGRSDDCNQSRYLIRTDIVGG